MLREIFTDVVVLGTMAAIAAGRVPGLRMNRASVAFAAAAALVAAGSVGVADALAAIDLGTLVLLLSMMLVAASMRLSGFFDWVAARLAGLAGSPVLFLAAIVFSSGVLSAAFLNDTICLLFAPIVAETALRARRDPVPYLVATAIAANVGSAATIIGNPQNMLIGAKSGIGFMPFLAQLGPVALMALVISWLCVMFAFPKEFFLRRQGLLGSDTVSPGSVAPIRAGVRVYKPLLWKSLTASVLMLGGFALGAPVSAAAALAAALIMVTRRLKPERVFSEVDFGLLVFFGGLFVVTKAAAGTEAFAWFERTLLAAAADSPLGYSVAAAGLSNVISNVPAVMVLAPGAAAAVDPERTWLILAMASTFAGNLTLLGSVANLIVAEGAASRGVKLGFWSYLKAGVPVTVLTILAGAWWLSR